MITLEEVMKLDEKVNSAVSVIKGLREENKLLLEKIDSYKEKIENLEKAVLSFQAHQQEIEAGIKNAVSTLDFTLGHIDATEKPVVKPTKIIQTEKSNPVLATEKEQEAPQPVVENSVSAPQTTKSAGIEPEAPTPTMAKPSVVESETAPITRVADLPSFVDGLKEQIKSEFANEETDVSQTTEFSQTNSSDEEIPGIEGLNENDEVAFDFNSDFENTNEYEEDDLMSGDGSDIEDIEENNPDLDIF